MDSSLIWIVILVSLTLLVVFGLAYAEESNLELKITIPKTEILNYKWTVICELINLEPYYDCPEYIDDYFDARGEEWLIVELPLYVFDDPKKRSSLGYAVYGDYKILEESEFGVCVRFPQLNQTINGMNLCGLKYIVIGIQQPQTCYSPYPCMSVLEHELKHLKCECDWHEGLYSKSMLIII